MLRRDFLKTAGIAGVGAMAFPSILRAQGANERVNFGIIGCGGMAHGNAEEFLNAGGQCVGICEIDQARMANMAKFLADRNNPEVPAYGDYRKLLENKDVDAVLICTPDHWHCLPTVDACSAGKDVYVEKPMANSIAECDAMTAAGKKYKRVIEIGQQQRSGEMWKAMQEFIQSGQLGKVSRVDVWGNFSYTSVRNPQPDGTPPDGVDFDMWLGPAPKRAFNPRRFHGIWRMFWDYGGGLMTDWGVHLLDMALAGTGKTDMPVSVTASGSNYAYPDAVNETFDTMNVTYDCGDFLMTWSNSPIEIGPYWRNYGIAFQGENGTMLVNREGFEVIPFGDRTQNVKMGPTNNDRLDHFKDFVKCIKSRDLNTICTPEMGALAAKYAHLGNIAARTGEKLRYDDNKRRFDSSDKANRLLKPKYRAPWKFPVV